jgi:putative transposase
VATWRGFVYVVYVIDPFSCRIVGWRAHDNAHGSRVRRAQAGLARPSAQWCLAVHSDRGWQYVSISYTDHLAGSLAALSFGSVGEALDDARAETVIGFFKTKVIYREGLWCGFEDVETVTLEWVARLNRRRRLAPLGFVPPAEFQA